jgi:hypothetical protein
MRYCPYCGAELVNNAVFCHQCNTKLQDYSVNQNINFNQTIKREKDTGLLILAVIEFFVFFNLPISGFMFYVALIFTGEIDDPSFMGGALHGEAGAKLQTGAMGADVGTVMPEYFFYLLVIIIFSLLVFQIITIYFFYTQKKFALTIGWIRPVIPFIAFLILLSVILFENIDFIVLEPIIVITVPSFLFGILILIYFYIRRDRLKKLLEG